MTGKCDWCGRRGVIRHGYCEDCKDYPSRNHLREIQYRAFRVLFDKYILTKPFCAAFIDAIIDTCDSNYEIAKQDHPQKLLALS